MAGAATSDQSSEPTSGRLASRTSSTRSRIGQSGEPTFLPASGSRYVRITVLLGPNFGRSARWLEAGLADASDHRVGEAPLRSLPIRRTPLGQGQAPCQAEKPRSG